MHETENEFKGTPVPAHPQNQPLPLAPLVQGNANDDDPDVIFAKAVAEIDTHPNACACDSHQIIHYADHWTRPSGRESSSRDIDLV